MQTKVSEENASIVDDLIPVSFALRKDTSVGLFIIKLL